MESLHMGAVELIIILFIAIIAVATGVLPWFWIYKKVGYSPAMGCLMLIPIANIIMLYFLAFTRWPIERELQNPKNSQPIEKREI